MLFREGIAASHRNIKLQVFASDVDPDAVASAREGLYPESIETDVSPERLARFFSKEDHSYRVLPALRATVVFTVQDVLADPPFSRIDFVSCRNLLIYLQPKPRQRSSRLSISRCARAACFFLVARRQLETTKAALRWSRRRLDFIGTLVEPVREISDFRETSDGTLRAPLRSALDPAPSRKPPWPTFASRWSWRPMLLPRS